MPSRLVEIALRRMPKFISPKTHAILDYATAGAFLAVGVMQWKRNRAASVAALANCGAILGASLMTDYPGGVKPLLSFRTHGKVDAGQAAIGGVLPAALGFRRRPIARFFNMQSNAEWFILSATDFEAAGRRGWLRRKRAA